MATSSAKNTPGPLPATLFSIYRTYKRETSIVIRWLMAFDQSAESSSGDNGNSAPQEMTARQIAERARMAAITGRRPPKNIESAFKVVIMNRSRLTKHYETLSSAAQGVQESTERHKIFNETLAEAYGLLFPKLKRSKKGKKNTRTTLPEPPTTTSSNTFETLAGLIEQEEHFDISASKFWEEDVPIPETERSVIAEDPIESSIARQAYLGEHQAIVEFTKSIWKSFAAGGGQLPQSTEKARRRFESLFRTVSEEREAKEAFAVSVAQLIRDKSQLSEEEFLEKEKKICTDRYSHDKLLLASLVKSASQSPACKDCVPIPAVDDIKARWDLMMKGNMQHPSAIPLISDLKEKPMNISEAMAAVMAAHTLLETGRSFLHESANLGNTPTSCRIILLRRVNEVINAMARLTDKDGPEVSYHSTTAGLFKILQMNLGTFLLDKTFDVYSQSPWVAGSYMSAVSELSLWVGLQMLNEQDAFGAVMHLYNMLQQLEIGCPQILILEQLRNIFKPVVFACKKEPKRDFGNIFELFRGGAKFYRKELPQGQFQILGQGGRPWEHRHALSKGSKISLDKLAPSAHHESFNRMYNLSEPFWIGVTGDPKVKRRCNMEKTHEDLFARYPPSELLSRTREFIRPEYEGTFPLA
ncbi:hypothetical protein J4E81_001733 [Alternaria sp. BMP 2799]|nr:hypothetical protein J4E81_001733 [Alternaria sp. BMP 2799]